MRATETEVRALGVDTMGLNVFGDDAAARSLYHELGYVETSISMSKGL